MLIFSIRIPPFTEARTSSHVTAYSTTSLDIAQDAAAPRLVLDLAVVPLALRPVLKHAVSRV